MPWLLACIRHHVTLSVLQRSCRESNSVYITSLPCYGCCRGYLRAHNTTSRRSVVGVMMSPNNRHCSSLAARAVSRALHRNTNYVALDHPLLSLQNNTLLDITPVRPLLYNPDLRTNAALLLLLLARIRPPLAGVDVDANFKAFF
ncbi:hypothetical protein NDU88_001707 [Pleurodeles waltl]|uniref:Uncharacterized protein n=1 Tax=Pleurodeles waltl TaxID=8319 RepID=A0AAV7WPF9_PLEWA|nr:hypothetical protein NDU88_001707 [Pleurodeles waltl]